MQDRGGAPQAIGEMGEYTQIGRNETEMATSYPLKGDPHQTCLSTVRPAYGEELRWA